MGAGINYYFNGHKMKLQADWIALMPGDFDFGRDFGALWGTPAHDRFIVKINYWIGL